MKNCKNDKLFIKYLISNSFSKLGELMITTRANIGHGDPHSLSYLLGEKERLLSLTFS